MSSKLIKTRFAPSPTGFLHLGALRTALYCYLYAKKHDGKFVLRIENTDQKRTVPGAIDQIKNSLLWSGLKYDEFYIQSERLPIYRKHVEILESVRRHFLLYLSSFIKNSSLIIRKGMFIAVIAVLIDCHIYVTMERRPTLAMTVFVYIFLHLKSRNMNVRRHLLFIE